MCVCVCTCVGGIQRLDVLDSGTYFWGHLLSDMSDEDHSSIQGLMDFWL